MTGRGQDRLAATVSVLLLALLAGFTYYVAELEGRDDSESYVASLAEPDYFVEGFSITRVDAAGQPAFKLAAERMEHFLALDRVEFQHPVATSLAADQARITITAERGRSDTRGDFTELEDAVRLVRSATDERPRLVIESDQMTLDTIANLVRGDRKVTAYQNGSSLTGVGFELNNATRQLRLDSQVRAVLVPASRP